MPLEGLRTMVSEKIIQEVDNVLIHINAQVLKSRQEFNAMSV